MKNKALILIILCFVFIVMWLFGISRIPPTFMADDSPATIAASYTLGVQHPPGYALNNLIGKVFSVIPAGNIMYRHGLMAMFFHIAAAFMVFFLMLRVVPEKAERSPTYFAGVVAATLYFFSGTAFLQGFSAKGSVYTSQAFIIACVFLSLFSVNNGVKKTLIKKMYLASFLLGLTAGNHWQSSAVLLPALFLCSYENRKYVKLTNLLNCFLFFIIGASILIYLFIRNNSSTVMSWGDVKDFSSLLWLLSRAHYLQAENAHTLGDGFRHLSYYFTNVLPGQYPLLLGFLLFPGLFLLIKERGKTGLILAFAYFCPLAGIFMTVTHMPGNEYFIKPYLTFTYIFVASFITYMLYRMISLINSIKAKKSAMIFTAVFLATFLSAKMPDYSRYFFGYDYAKNMLKSMPENSVFFGEGDVNNGGMLYMIHVEKKNYYPIKTALLNYEWYRSQIERNYRGKATIPGKGANGIEDLKNIMYANKDSGVYYSNAYTKEWISYGFAPRGIVNEVLINQNAHTYDPYNYYRIYSFRGIFDNKIRMDEITEMFVLRHYSMSLVELAQGFERNGNIREALFLYEKSMLFFRHEQVLQIIRDIKELL